MKERYDFSVRRPLKRPETIARLKQRFEWYALVDPVSWDVDLGRWDDAGEEWVLFILLMQASRLNRRRLWFLRRECELYRRRLLRMPWPELLQHAADFADMFECQDNPPTLRFPMGFRWYPETQKQVPPFMGSYLRFESKHVFELKLHWSAHDTLAQLLTICFFNELNCPRLCEQAQEAYRTEWANLYFNFPEDLFRFPPPTRLALARPFQYPPCITALEQGPLPLSRDASFAWLGFQRQLAAHGGVACERNLELVVAERKAGLPHPLLQDIEDLATAPPTCSELAQCGACVFTEDDPLARLSPELLRRLGVMDPLAFRAQYTKAIHKLEEKPPSHRAPFLCGAFRRVVSLTCRQPDSTLRRPHYMVFRPRDYPAEFSVYHSEKRVV